MKKPVKMSAQESEHKRTCTMCKKVSETFSGITYSQGERVCRDCKKINQKADDLEFDRYMSLRHW